MSIITSAAICLLVTQTNAMDIGMLSMELRKIMTFFASS